MRIWQSSPLADSVIFDMEIIEDSPPYVFPGDADKGENARDFEILAHAYLNIVDWGYQENPDNQGNAET